MNLEKKKTLNNKLVPNSNEEYYLYQTLIGSFPFEQSEISGFKRRLTLHMTKAIREMKKNSMWTSPNLQYEEYVSSFIAQILDLKKPNKFLQEFIQFEKKITFCGFLNSLSQTLIKITCPGIPDFYQGTELWDLNLVDPDNRRSVDFEKRISYLEEIKKLKPADLPELVRNFADGRIKLYETNKSLEIRRKKKNLFQKGLCIWLKVKGAFSHCIIAFCRKTETDSAVTICPRFPTKITDMQHLALSEVWKDTFVCLPNGTSKVWTEIFTRKTLLSQRQGVDEGFYVRDVLLTFPVALIISGEQNENC